MLNLTHPEHEPILRDALRAPSAHNAQAWRLTPITDTARYELHYDHNDYLPFDPDDRDAYLAMGAFYETLRLAAHRHGFNADFEEHYFTIYEDEAHHPVLRQFAVFDLLANNTDRKSGHVLLGDDGRLWGIDNGLCFHPDPKIRTVIWEFGGERIPDDLLDAVRDALPKVDVLETLLDDEERDAVRSRAERLLKVKTFPLADPSGRCYPWPMV